MIDPGHRTKDVLQTWRHIGWIIWPWTLIFFIIQYFKQPASFTIRFVLIGVFISCLIHGMFILLYKVFSKDIQIG